MELGNEWAFVLSLIKLFFVHVNVVHIFAQIMCREVSYIGGVSTVHVYIYIERKWIEIGWRWCLGWQWRKRAYHDSGSGTLLAYTYMHTKYIHHLIHHIFVAWIADFAYIASVRTLSTALDSCHLYRSATRFRSHSPNNINSQGANHIWKPGQTANHREMKDKPNKKQQRKRER